MALVAAGCNRPGSQADLRPIANQNVLLITIDTLRADALGSYGGRAATPALDRLAAEGVRFDFAHAHAVTTLSSHASILTGAYPFQHGIRDNSGYRLTSGARTAATLLKRAGYETAAFIGAFPLHSRFGLNQGFDRYDEAFGESRAPADFVMPERPATTVVALARDWIAERGAGGAGGAGGAAGAGGAGGAGRAGGAGGAGEAGGTRPWFVWVHVFDPHAPYKPPPPFDQQYAARPYDGEVAATDAAIAPLLDDLRTASRSTLVIATGDHGEGLGDHGEMSHGLFAYEATLRIPLIVAELGAGRAGGAGAEISSVAARHVDVLPTMLDAIGQALPPDLAGRSLLPAAERRAGAAPRPSYFESMGAMLNRGWAPLTGVLADRDKLIDLPIAERYDLAADPGESVNLSGRAPERDRTLAGALRAFNAPPPGDRRAEDADAAARLRALGYVSGSAPGKTRYTDADDPKRLVDLDQAVHNAVDAAGARRFADAVQIYQGVIARRPDMAIAYRHLAFVEWQRGNAAGAVDALRRAIAAGVTQASIVAQLAGYLTETGHLAEAIRLLEPLARAPDADAETLNALGIAYIRVGRRDEAARVFERVLSANPDSSVPLENLGVMALERGNLAAARRQFERAVRANPRSSRAHGGLGVVALREGDHRAAIASWARAVELDPGNFDAVYNAGTTLARDGQLDAARPYLELFLKTAPPAFFAKDLKEVAALLERR